MDVVTIVANSVIPVFAVIGLGYAFGRRGAFDIKPLVDFVIYAAIPALVIKSLGGRHIPLSLMITTGSAALFVVMSVGLVALVYAKVSGKWSKDLFVCAMFANVANLPFPLALLAFGEEALSYQVVYMAVQVTLMYTVGVAIAAGSGKGIFHFLKLPLVYASTVGIGLSVCQVAVPVVVMTPIAMLGDTAIPILLFTLGYKMAGNSARSAFSATPIVLIRLLGGAAAGLAFVFAVDPPLEVKRAVLLACAMPSAVQSFMLCAKFTSSGERAAAAVFFSTALALLYIPFLMGWLTTL